MTWLPIQVGEGSERDIVLGLKEEPYDAMRRVLATTWRITDPHALDLCRRRLAQLTGARAELAGADEHLLAELEDWRSSTRLTDHERAALSFAEQYHYDHHLLDSGPRGELERHLSRRELVNFVWALHMNDAYIRVMSLLDIAPDPETAPARVERTPPAGRGGVGGAQPGSSAPGNESQDVAVRSLMDSAFVAAYGQLNPVVVRQTLVDEVTSEAVRLHNASHQSCLY